jgi:hypothetical protein
LRPIEIEIIPVSVDRISVSVNYNLPGSVPMIKRWQIDKATVDEVCEEVKQIAGASLDGTGPDAEVPARGGSHRLEEAGRTFFEILFREQCDTMRRTTGASDVYFVFKVDRTLAHLPFEILHDGRAFLSRNFALGRLIYSESPGQHPAESEAGGESILILGDPSEDPVIRDDVEREVDSLRDLFKRSGTYRTTIAMGREVSERMILSLLPDAAILHFTGHGSPGGRGPAGLDLYGGRVLTAESLRGVGRPPAVAFFNTCSAASDESWRSPLGIMETLMARGTRACIAPIWDVASDAATSIALSFYSHLLRGASFGQALRKARSDAAAKGDPNDPTWAAYALYGNPVSHLTLKEHAPSGGGIKALRIILAILLGLLLILTPGPNRRETTRVAAPPQVGYVIVESEPADARIFLDGEDAGLTPSAIEVNVGKHQIAIMKMGYRRWEASIDVEEGPETVVRAILQEISR